MDRLEEIKNIETMIENINSKIDNSKEEYTFECAIRDIGLTVIQNYLEIQKLNIKIDKILEKLGENNA